MNPPLPTLLSQALVAFTIEFDNEFERQMPHSTTRHGAGSAGAGPWLVSMVMWLNCMRFVGEAGIRSGELAETARTGTNLNGMERWGYITVLPDPNDRRARIPRSDWIVRATAKGRRAQEVWAPLSGEIERRWMARFGRERVGQLRDALRFLVNQIDSDLPDCLPILGYGLFSRPADRGKPTPGGQQSAAPELPLAALLSRALLAFAIEFESESDLSLAIGANVMRLLDRGAAKVRDLPGLSGVSKESIAMALGVLAKMGATVLQPDSAGAREKIVRLTPRGHMTLDSYRQLVAAIGDRWMTRYGPDVIHALRETLDRLVGEGTATDSPLFRGLEPYPDGWRAQVRRPATLPHFPMTLHRGGFPDGS